MLLTSEEKSNIITNVMLPGTHRALQPNWIAREENVTEEALIHAVALPLCFFPLKILYYTPLLIIQGK